MTSIQITAAQAALLDGSDQSISRDLRTRAQNLADVTGKTCEVYHPEGYVWDARSPQREFSRWAHISGRAVTDAEVQGYEVAAYFPDGVYAGPDQHGIYPVLS